MMLKGYHHSKPACALTRQPPQVTLEITFGVVLFHPIELLKEITGSLALPVLKLGGEVIVLDALLGIAGTDLFDVSPPSLETEEARLVLRSGVEYAVGPTSVATPEELALDEEKVTKFEAIWLSMLLFWKDDCDCGVPGDPTVELANGSNSYSNQENQFLQLLLGGIPDCRFLLSRCHCNRVFGSAQTIGRTSARISAMVKRILQRAVVVVVVWANE